MTPDFHAIAFLSIFFSSLVDAFFITGLFLYGMLLVGTSTALHATGHITTAELFVAGFLGSTLGCIGNFICGYCCGQLQIVRKVTSHQTIAQVRYKLDKHGLFLTILVCKFIGILRPFYGVVLGALHVSPRRFIMYEMIVGTIWITVWILILLSGEDLFMRVFG